MSFGYSHNWVFGTKTEQTQRDYLLPGAINESDFTNDPIPVPRQRDPVPPVDPSTCVLVDSACKVQHFAHGPRTRRSATC